MIRTITPIFSILVALFVFFFYSKPLFTEISQVQGEAVQYMEAAAKAQELNDELSKKLAMKRSYDAQSLERLDALVPSSIDEIHVLADINAIAKKHGVLFGNVNVSDADAPATRSDDPYAEENQGGTGSQTITYADFTVANIDFSLIGTYNQFKSFIADLEKSLVMLEVVGIDFTRGEGELMQYTVSVRLFSLPPIE